MRLKSGQQPSTLINRKINQNHDCLISGCYKLIVMCITCKLDFALSEMRIDKARKTAHIYQCKECISLRSSKHRKKFKLKYTLLDYKNNAKKRNREFTLIEEETVKLLTSDCHYCGQAPEPLNGIDRMDNKIGYTLDNCITACRDCNYRKGQMSYDDFNTWLDKILKFKSH